MDQSKHTLYKNTLYLTTGIFVFLMCVATSSPALMSEKKSVAVQPEQAQAVPTLGRFVVTPSASRFVPAPPKKA